MKNREPPKLRVCKPGEVPPPPPEAGPYSPLPLTTDHSQHCSHEQSRVHPSLRKIICSKCSADLDPVDVVLKLARNWDRHAWARDEHTKLRREIDEMKTELRNLKAQKRRAER